MTIPAYVYARWSTAEQSKGDSLKRQVEGGKAFIQEMKWEYDDSRHLIDEGKSAFHGANRELGSALYEFEQKAAAGHFKNGAALVVENIDRLTRQGWEAATDIIRALTAQGVTVGIWQFNEVFPANQRIDGNRVQMLILRAMLSEEESEKKRKRLLGAWKTKYDELASGERKVVTGMLPGWLEKSADGKTIKPIPHRVKVLNEIYEHYIEGKGLPWIEKELNRRGEPNWARGKQAGKPWGVHILHRHLTSRAVLGEFAPKSRNGKDRVSRGFVIPDYYPQVISAEKFNKAQAVRQTRKRTGGRNQYSLPNLFSGIAKCGECQGSMGTAGFIKAGQSRTQTRKSGKRTTYTAKEDKGFLACRNAQRKLGCTNNTYHPYYPLEAAVLSHLWDFANRGEQIAPNSKAARMSKALAESERQIELKREQMENIAENLTTLKSETLTRKLVALEQEVAADEAALTEARRELQVEMGKAPPKEDLEALVNARAALHSDDPETRHAARSKTHQSLKRLINVMNCERDGRTMIVFGNYGAGITFDGEGNCADLSALNARYEGPDGEPDWHPDDDREAAE